ncbi:MAG: glucosyl-3-phosphoglycerate synthase [Chloroflexi bacterium]|nr:glucosyl-3-phosphoglycerate synthase [Chloroflexota bacterium]
MSRKRALGSMRRVLVPVVYGCDSSRAVALAHALAAEVVLLGLVRMDPGEPLSAGASRAREVRMLLAALAQDGHTQVKARVRVSHTPWADLCAVIGRDTPNLLLLEAGSHLEAMGVTPQQALTSPPCDLGIVRGPVPHRPRRVLVPVRGGPHAELALRVGLALRAEHLTPLHLRSDLAAPTEPPFRGLEHVLRQMPDAQLRVATTTDPAGTILSEAGGCDLVILGATAQPLQSGASLGPVADRVLRECPAGVVVVKTRRPMPALVGDIAAVGSKAISILVDRWFSENTYDAGEFADLARLAEIKAQRGVSVSLALPALNEETTVGKVIRTVRRALVERAPLLDEIVLIDSESSDRTRQIAADLGVPVFIHQQLLPELGARQGKGEALWKSLLVTRGDIVLWIDTDIVNIHPRFVYGILGPLLADPRVQFVKGFYRRPLRVGDRMQAGGGGRVTELTARPLLNLFYPELSGVVQPLSGEYGGRRSALEQLPFYSGYGVESGLLIDVFERFGLSAIAQVDLLERIHHNQPLEALSKMSFAIIQAVVHKLERRYQRPFLEDVNKSMKLIRYQEGGYFLDVEAIAEGERPPMIEVPAYRRAHPHPSREAPAGSKPTG